MFLGKLAIFLTFSVRESYAEFYGKYEFRLTNGNTGQIMVGTNYGSGISSYGSVCQG